MVPGGISQRAIKGETEADYSFFSVAACAFLPPLGKLALAAERGKVSKSNLKYALEVIFGGFQD